MRRWWMAAGAVTFVGLAACGGSTEEAAFAELEGGAGDASSGDAARDASGDAGDTRDAPADRAVEDAGPIACGNQTCSGLRVCVHPCCGGAAPPCYPRPDSGVCPPGTHLETCGCRMDPCTPAPPYCADAPPNDCSFKTGPRNYSCICA